MNAIDTAALIKYSIRRRTMILGATAVSVVFLCICTSVDAVSRWVFICRCVLAMNDKCSGIAYPPIFCEKHRLNGEMILIEGDARRRRPHEIDCIYTAWYVECVVFFFSTFFTARHFSCIFWCYEKCSMFPLKTTQNSFSFNTEFFILYREFTQFSIKLHKIYISRALNMDVSGSEGRRRAQLQKMFKIHRREW